MSTRRSIGGGFPIRGRPIRGARIAMTASTWRKKTSEDTRKKDIRQKRMFGGAIIFRKRVIIAKKTGLIFASLRVGSGPGILMVATPPTATQKKTATLPTIPTRKTTLMRRAPVLTTQRSHEWLAPASSG